ncbi:hypothetical protein BABINDRAFT_162468 [Babjeviella inositovora NRRL Y-12698]|uniref:Uncharacterized protein n=1 Tax=Babjeviella inositovora NRRL Y-12698 TaxID=984486 RepID=A0A1E3QP77_9ASCO|nr:uncharacterized protein BABINDRAFT_162468 [Babjeviella inositovora NRRL Y-12698]ODQ78787.1 hypothetical protein BABINDRAFT_162468 [Babjeviella inositovora NRRL Y-12698]
MVHAKKKYELKETVTVPTETTASIYALQGVLPFPLPSSLPSSRVVKILPETYFRDVSPRVYPARRRPGKRLCNG